MSTATEGIVTPEAVVLELELAGVASRVFAGIIDAAIQMVIYIALGRYFISGLMSGSVKA